MRQQRRSRADAQNVFGPFGQRLYPRDKSAVINQPSCADTSGYEHNSAGVNFGERERIDADTVAAYNSAAAGRKIAEAVDIRKLPREFHGAESVQRLEAIEKDYVKRHHGKISLKLRSSLLRSPSKE